MGQVLSRYRWAFPALSALLSAIALFATLVPAGSRAAPVVHQHGLMVPSSLPAPGIRWRFDGGYVDELSHRLYQTDTTNAAVHVFDLSTQQEIGLLRGFAGLGSTGFDHNGPNHVLGIGRDIAVSDGDGTIKIFDVQFPAHPQLTQTIWLGGTGRTDAMAWDGEHQVLAVVNSAPADSFVTFLSTRPLHILRKISFPAQDIRGLDDIRFDPLTHHFFLSAGSSGTPSILYPYGALVELSPQRVIHTYAIPYVCDPAGLATHDGRIAIGCASGNPLLFSGGTFVQIPFGNGSDFVAANARYFLFAASGDTRGSTLLVTDLHGHLLQRIATTPGSHSVTAARSGAVYVPESGKGIVIFGDEE